jgi:hypothetical protein
MRNFVLNFQALIPKIKNVLQHTLKKVKKITFQIFYHNHIFILYNIVNNSQYIIFFYVKSNIMSCNCKTT